MGRPRKTSQEKEHGEILRRKVLALRLALGKSRPQFARMVGVSADIVIHRETGRAPWRSEEIAAAKAKIGEHLSTALSSLSMLPD